jgi:hypothetical protein
MPAIFRPLLALLVASASLALGLAPGTARADTAPLAVPAPDALMATAHGYAVTRWNADPCGGQVATSWAHMGPGINARSQWLSIDVRDALSFSACSITYNLDVDWDWPKLCTVVEHELGHLAGHDHVNNPHDVMSPYYVYPAPECAARGDDEVTPDASARVPRATAKKKAHKRKASTKAKAAAKAKAKAKTRTKRKASKVAKRHPKKPR